MVPSVVFYTAKHIDSVPIRILRLLITILSNSDQSWTLIRPSQGMRQAFQQQLVIPNADSKRALPDGDHGEDKDAVAPPLPLVSSYDLL